MLDQDLFRHIFFPYATERAAEVVRAGRRFVYYTGADTAVQILKHKQVWLRNTQAMNDFMEVEHGFECLNAAYKGEAGAELRQALDACFEGLADELLHQFNAWLPGIRNDTYITCVSEHLQAEEQNGRLSMWRAYGGQNGVAIVINGDVMFGSSRALGAFSSPVAYWTQDDMASEINKIAKRIRDHRDFVVKLGREGVRSTLFEMYRYAVLSTKHPGFAEEMEWRIIANPLLHPDGLLVPSVEIVRGVPQVVQKLTFENHPDKGLIGLALPELLHKVIIGPCEFPRLVYRAIHETLAAAGIESPGQRIVVSEIPLRHQ